MMIERELIKLDTIGCFLKRVGEKMVSIHEAITKKPSDETTRKHAALTLMEMTNAIECCLEQARLHCVSLNDDDEQPDGDEDIVIYHATPENTWSKN